MSEVSKVVFADNMMGRDLDEEKAKSWAKETTIPYMISEQIISALTAKVIGPQHLVRKTLTGATQTLRFVKAKKALAQDLSEGEELTNTMLEAESVSITADEVGIMVTVTDRLETTDFPSASAARSEQVAHAMTDKLDMDICKLFGTFEQTIGTSTSTLKVTDFLTGIAKLELADADKGMPVCILHPAQVHDLRLDMLNAPEVNKTGTGSIQALRLSMGDLGRFGAATNGMFGTFFDIPIYCTTNVHNVGNVYQGGFFISNYALGMVSRYMGKVETTRWMTLRANAMMVTSFYGLGEIEGRAGFTVTTKRTPVT